MCRGTYRPDRIPPTSLEARRSCLDLSTRLQGLWGAISTLHASHALKCLYHVRDAVTIWSQICVGAHEIVEKLRHEVEELPEGRTVDLHGGVLAVENDAMLVVVHTANIAETTMSR